MRITLQLYTVRNEIAADLPGTLKAIADTGIEYIEGGGLSVEEAKSWKAMMDENGLKLSGAHYMLNDDSDIDAVAEAMAIMESDTVIVPWVQPENFATDDKAIAFAEMLNRVGAKVRAKGLKFLYHNHDFEFTPSDSGVTYNAFLNTLDPAICGLEVDVAWVGVAGHDPVAFINQYADRVGTLHLKDFNPALTPRWTVAGSGTVPLEAVLEFAKERSVPFGAIELDESPIAPLDAVQQSFDYFKSLGFH